METPVGRLARWAAYLRERRAPIALLFVAPAIPELLTGSTPITLLVLSPVDFLVRFGLDMALYGTGALLIREFAVVFRKGWGSILLLGAAYGIAEEGFAVHTFFQPSGAPVGVLTSYGHAFGVNWLWALGLTAFHATYSIALPILWVHLWLPAERGKRWLGRGSLLASGAIYLGIVGVFDGVVAARPPLGTFLFFLAIVAVLCVLAYRLPGDLLSARPGPTRLGRVPMVLLGTLGFDAWVLVLVLASIGRLPAVVTAALFVAVELATLAVILRRVGTDDLVLAQYRFSTGMLGVLFVWDIPAEFSVPGILGLAVVFAILQYALGRWIPSGPGATVPPGAVGPSTTP